MANSTGKKIMKTGVRMVPNPKPEKKVRMATKNATRGIMMYSMICVNFIFKSTMESAEILSFGHS
jgi:hypothetical protein